MLIYTIPGFSEPFSSISHLLAAVVFLVIGTRFILQKHHSKMAFFSLLIFAISGISLLTISGILHLLSPDSLGQMVFRRLDHSAIFLLIAGTFTPVHCLLFTGFLRWGILGIIWILSIICIILKIIYFDSIPEWLGLTTYLTMGWIGLLTGILLYRRYHLKFIKYLLMGALFYTLGAVMEFLRIAILIPGVIGPHELFHIAVIGGIFFHWKFIHAISKNSAQHNRTPTAL